LSIELVGIVVVTVGSLVHQTGRMTHSGHSRGPSVPVACPVRPVVAVLHRSDDSSYGGAVSAPCRAV
jgi:hypothetical protein